VLEQESRDRKLEEEQRDRLNRLEDFVYHQSTKIDQLENLVQRLSNTPLPVPRFIEKPDQDLLPTGNGNVSIPSNGHLSVHGHLVDHR
jgi:hypothetical protein